MIRHDVWLGNDAITGQRPRAFASCRTVAATEVDEQGLGNSSEEE
jgi:hypothetical protein